MPAAALLEHHIIAMRSSRARLATLALLLEAFVLLIAAELLIPGPHTSSIALINKESTTEARSQLGAGAAAARHGGGASSGGSGGAAPEARVPAVRALQLQAAALDRASRDASLACVVLMAHGTLIAALLGLTSGGRAARALLASRSPLAARLRPLPTLIAAFAALLPRSAGAQAGASVLVAAAHEWWWSAIWGLIAMHQEVKIGFGPAQLQPGVVASSMVGSYACKSLDSRQ